MKRFIKHPERTDLDKLVQNLGMYMGIQVDKLMQSHEEEKIRRTVNFMIPFFSKVNGKVSYFALLEAKKGLDIAKYWISLQSKPTLCKGQYSAEMGIPCAHICYDILCNKTINILQFKDFSSQWLLPNAKSSVESAYIAPPQIQIQNRKCSKKKRRKHSSGRLLSAVEIARKEF